MVRQSVPAPLLAMRDVSVDFEVGQGFLSPRSALRAVENVSLSLSKAETLAVVGESGSGKTTLGRLIVGDINPTRGEVLINGAGIAKLDRRARARLAQPVVQDPSAALDPRWRIGRLLNEPFKIHKGLAPNSDKAIAEILEATRLSAKLLDRFPHELSGGQLQRVAIARALLLRPELLVCDEAVSALDTAVQAEIVELLKDIQKKFGTAILFITHDLHLVPSIADRVAVMYLGALVEIGSVKDVGGAHSHPYTKALYGAAPRIGRADGRRATLQGEPPSPINKPGGCTFHPRCPIAVEKCASLAPAQVAHAHAHYVSCHLIEPATMAAHAPKEGAQ